LLHDIGHPPFGHSGEEILNQKMEHFGGFEGNAQTLRIVSCLENRLGRSSDIATVMKEPRGLNLTVGTLASVLKYDFRSMGPTLKVDKLYVTKGYYPTEEPTVKALHERLGIEADKRLYTIECQIMDMADDIAYSAYDLEDTLEAGIVTPFDLMSIDDTTLGMLEVDVRKGVAKRDDSIQISKPIIVKHLSDVFGTLLRFAKSDSPYRLDTHRLDRLAFVGRTYAESIQHAKNPLVRRQYLETLIEQNIASLYLDFDHSMPCLSVLRIDPSRLVTIEALKAFNFHKVITSRRLELQHHRNRKIIGVIFDALASDDRGVLLSDFQREQLGACDGDKPKRMRLISDIVSSLTDTEALNLYDQLNSSRNGRFWTYSR
jgi:dGTPase